MKLKKGDFEKFALEDLNQMEYNSKNGFEQAFSTCMHAQQYAEKMIKDKIVELFDTEPEKTHNLRVLLATILPEGYELDPDIMLKAGILSDYYMATRYPDFGGMDEISAETAEEAYRWSLEIVAFIECIHIDDNGRLFYGRRRTLAPQPFLVMNTGRYSDRSNILEKYLISVMESVTTMLMRMDYGVVTLSCTL